MSPRTRSRQARMPLDRARARLALREPQGLSRAARIVLLSVVAVVAGIELLWLLTGQSTDPLASAMAQVLLTLAFGVFAWRPAAASVVLVASAGVALLLDVGVLAVLVLAVAAGLVVATSSRAVIAGYVVAVVALSVIAMLRTSGGASAEDVTTLVVIAGLSSVAGSYLRVLRGRRLALASALVEQDAARELATQIERDRIADELHDLIAHELTIIAMHAQVLQLTRAPASRAVAQAAIADAARKALADLRRVLHVAQVSRDSADLDVDSVRNQLAVSLEDIRAQIESAGGSVDLPRDPSAIIDALPPSLDTALGRIAREAVWNVLKHAGAGARVSIRLERVGDDVRLAEHDQAGGVVVSPDLPSGGYGLARMRARAEVLGGTFEAGPVDGGWLVAVRLPIG